MQSDEITQIVKEYAARQEAFEQETNELKAVKIGGLQSHKRDVVAVEKAIKSETEKLTEVK